MSGQIVLELRDVSVRRGQRTILGPINFSITAGERWVVLGPNGAGKSTLIQILATRTFPTTGTVSILDKTMGRVDLFELRTRIVFVALSLPKIFPMKRRFVMSCSLQHMQS